MNLDEAAGQLYVLQPAQFVAARNELARTARGAGDAALAKEIAALRRPSRGAAAVNQIANTHRDELEALLTIGDQLRAAQESADGAQLRRLTRDRRQALTQLLREVQEHGAPLGPSVEREVETTLEAAVADPAAGSAVRSGRLVRGLAATGFEPVDLVGAVAGGVPAAPTPRAGRTANRAGPAATSATKKADRRAERVTAARDVVREAQSAVKEADTQLRTTEQALRKTERARRDAAARMAQADEAARQARRADAAAASELRAAQRGHDRANRAVAEARDRLARSEAALRESRQTR